MVTNSDWMKSRSSRSPLPEMILSRASWSLSIPIRQGVHFRQEMSPSNSAKYLATSTMHTPSSMATSAPVSFSKYTSAR